MYFCTFSYFPLVCSRTNGTLLQLLELYKSFNFWKHFSLYSSRFPSYEHFFIWTLESTHLGGKKNTNTLWYSFWDHVKFIQVRKIGNVYDVNTTISICSGLVLCFPGLFYFPYNGFGTLSLNLGFFFFFSWYTFFLNWSIITIQYCAGFCHTSTWISHRYTYAPSLLNLPSTPLKPRVLKIFAIVNGLFFIYANWCLYACVSMICYLGVG